MLIKPLPVLATLLAATIGLAGQGGSTAFFKAHYDKTDAIFKKMDLAGLAKVSQTTHTPDFVAISLPDKTGKVQRRTLQQTLQGMKNSIRLIASFDKVTSHIDHADMSNGKAVLTVQSVIEATTKKLPDGKTHKIGIYGKSQDTWVKVGSTWKIQTAQALSRNMTLDGKPAPQAKAH